MSLFYVLMFSLATSLLSADFTDFQKVVTLEKKGNGLNYIIGDLSKATIHPKFSPNFIKKRNAKKFQLELLLSFREPKNVLASYVILNRLFPDKAIEIVKKPFIFLGEEITLVPIEFTLKQPSVQLKLSTTDFGVMVQRYWAEQLDLEIDLVGEVLKQDTKKKQK